ncbi:MAG: hypothetical protein IJS00_01220 [Paludibacteraceae bacterium]|nr:hypothetical protein [Paludibacteraceae bacterium]
MKYIKPKTEVVSPAFRLLGWSEWVSTVASPEFPMVGYRPRVPQGATILNN